MHKDTLGFEVAKIEKKYSDPEGRMGTIDQKWRSNCLLGDI